MFGFFHLKSCVSIIMKHEVTQLEQVRCDTWFSRGVIKQNVMLTSLPVNTLNKFRCDSYSWKLRMFLNNVIEPFVMRTWEKKRKKREAHEFSRVINYILTSRTNTQIAVTAFQYFQNLLEEMAIKYFVALLSVHSGNR